MQLKYHMVTIEDLVPKDHLLRRVEAVLDLSFVYEETAHLYSRKYGHPAINPVVLVKYLHWGICMESFQNAKSKNDARTATLSAGI